MKTGWIIMVLLLFSGIGFADEMRPGFLELREQADGSWEAFWKTPARGPQQRLSLNVVLPDDCITIVSPKATYTGSAFVERWIFQREGGLAGAKISIDGLARTATDVLVRIQPKEGSSQTARLTPGRASMTVAAAPTSSEVAKTYTVFGVQHILEGLDHLLFVLCLMIVAGANHKLLITVTGFTVAHSITLALSALGVVNIPRPPVEAVIALSIVFLATEIAKACRTEKKDSLTYRYPVVVSSSFGLLHGFGFAAVLSEIGLPQGEIPIALLFFNVGVEFGQLMFIAAVLVVFLALRFVVKSVWRNPHPVAVKLAPQMAAYAIGGYAFYWLIQRIVGFA